MARVVVAAAVAASLAVPFAPEPVVAGEDLKALRAPDAAARGDALRRIARASDDDLRADAAFLRTAVRKALARDEDPRVRGLAASALFRLEGDDAVPAVLAAMAAEREPAAEVLLAASWSGAASDRARRALAEAAADREDLRRAALAAEALGSLPAGAGRDDLFALLDDAAPWPSLAGACLGLRAFPEVRTVTSLLARLRHPDPAVRSAARETLAHLTGEDRGPDPVGWETWWAAAAPTWKFPDAAVPADAGDRAGERAADRRTSDGPGRGSRTWATFHGIEIAGCRVAFVMDTSQSMWGPRREKAERELVDAVKSLPTTSHFSVVLFNESVWDFRAAPLPARPQEKLDLVRYLPDLETKSYTNVHDAVEHALGLLGVGRDAVRPPPGVEDILVLTDGVPNRGRVRDPARIVESLTALNGGRARIHGVALSEEGAPLVRALAAANGGRFAAAPIAK